jgi:heterodisulfide reductase subunit A-like polyferredoxin
MQAALDLAAMNHDVYLLDRAATIGGNMARLDKTFPTNDCSTCMISPKMVACARNPRIHILTLSELSSLEGEPGRFVATIKQHPRFVDEKTCTGCGECARVCPVSRKSEFDMGMGECKAIYRPYAQSVPGAFVIEKKGTSPCKVACPEHISVQGYVALVAEGKYREALQLIKEENPLPAICGRVCHHPCEAACKRGKVDEPVAIDSIKRFVADLDLRSETRFVPEIKTRREERVAVIGSGPAGLTCAYYLAIEGYRVTVFEKLPVLGGMLTVGIPSYRLPRDTIEAEIEVIREMGVELKTGVEIGKDVTMAELREQGYKAFFVAIGAHGCKSLGIEGEELDGVYPGVDFLREVNLGRSVALGDRVAVVGGGNVAMDAVRTALRTGSARPFVIYRRSLDEMPANAEEIEECREEGIEILTLTNPTRIIGENGRVTAIECVKMALGEPDASGRCRPEPVPGSEFILEVDAVIPAIGQESDWACLTSECACTIDKWRTMVVDPVTFQSDAPDIFAGGDAVVGPATVIEAIAHGKQAAVSIGRFIRDEDLHLGREKEWRAVEDVRTDGIDAVPRARMERLEPALRLDGFDEVQLGFSEEQARREAERCLNCGVCSECYRCEEVCLAKAVKHEDEPRRLELSVGAVILSAGYETALVPQAGEYGHGRYPNVVTNLEYERMLSASGPFGGHPERASDGVRPKKVAWIQCVGSRDATHNRNFCSSVCCMAAVKQAIITRDHDAESEAAIFYMDMRAHGKDFDRYVARAKDNYGVRLVPSMISQIIQNPVNRNLAIHYYDRNTLEFRQEQFDLVVLSTGMKPSATGMSLMRQLGIEQNSYGFTVPNQVLPTHTSREGIFVCGSLNGPKDIPEAVTEASAAAASAAVLLAGYRAEAASAESDSVEAARASRGLASASRENASASSELEGASSESATTSSVFASTMNGLASASNETSTLLDELARITNEIAAVVADAPVEPPASAASAASLTSATSVAHLASVASVASASGDARDTTGDPPRIGVFICHCGRNIAGVVDVDALSTLAKALPNVEAAEHFLFTCSTQTQDRIKELIVEKRLNRVVVAACSPRTHEPLFRETLQQAGLNKYLFEMANIRDQCAWVHGQEPEAATEKAGRLIQAATARAAQLESIRESVTRVVPQALVIGGGLAGMTAALTLADQGIPTTLVEKSSHLGGMAREIHHTLEGHSPRDLAEILTPRVKMHRNIALYTGATVSKITGGPGHFQGVISRNGSIISQDFGAIIVATGGEPYRPTGSEYFYGQHPAVVTQLELEKRLFASDGPLPETTVMIQCVGSRREDFPLCSRICCSMAVKNAIQLKRRNPKGAVFILYRDMRTFGFKEEYYKEARDLGVVFLRFEPEFPPDVQLEDGSLKVTAFDAESQMDLEIKPDLLVLSTGIRPRPEAADVASMLKLPMMQEGFFLEAHPKLAPLDFSSAGVFLCGLAHSPRFMEETLAQAKGAASRAAGLLLQHEIHTSAVVAQVDPDRCSACLVCVYSCPYNVPKVNGEGYSVIDARSCQGCGTCASECPAKAITLKHYTDSQVIAQAQGAAVCGNDVLDAIRDLLQQ